MFKIQTVTKPNSKPLYYKRIIWMGFKDKLPNVNDHIHQNSKVSIKEYLAEVNTFPCLLQWITSEGEQKYAEVTRDTDRRTA
jgi:hypothetical protein